MPQTSDEQIALCLRLFMAHESINSISKRSDTPSRPTITKYHDEGALTNGVPWDQYRDQQEETALAESREKALAKRAESARTFIGDLKEFIETEAYVSITQKIVDGDFDVSIGDLDKLARLYALLDNQNDEKMEFASWFARKVFDVALDIMDERQFALFKTRVATLQHEVEVKLNPMDHNELPS
jgi:hypothetical protein